MSEDMVIRPMTAEDKRVWVEALRSGEYEQGRGQLECGGRFCCLGVANKVLSLGFPGTSGSLTRFTPDGVERLFIRDADARALVRMNDGIGVQPKSFAEIADYIEAHVEPVG